MKPSSNSGFTIVETMLFLGISGLLAMSVLMTVGGSINVQRYHDSVTSLRSTLQQQYSDVANVSNDSTGVRGQSDEVILGKFIKTSGNNRLTIQTVKGKISGSNSSDDVATLTSYGVSLMGGSNVNYDIEWGATVKPLGADGFSILILRSPSSGIIRTFTDNKNVIDDNKFATLIDPSFLTNPLTICVDSGLLFTPKMSVIVAPDSTGPSGVQTKGDDSGC